MTKVAAAKRPLTMVHSTRITGNFSNHPSCVTMMMNPTSRLTSFPLRNKSAATEGSRAKHGPITSTTNVFELGVQLERQADIIANIKKSKAEILEKQSFGR